MVISKYLICAFFILYFVSSCYSLDNRSSELEFILSNNPIYNVQKTQKHAHIGILTGMIRFYQLFISTQDVPVCNFIPSCSQFGIDSLREFGVIRGILITSDRLQRCNGTSAPYYKLDYKSGKFIDPVQVYDSLLNRRQKQ
jgi:putative component of membrane protein insertase Oxa1/YidC/SpoIIIJ protein YidD